MNGRYAGQFLKRKYLRVVIAGGGTGGHLFPGIAIAESFIERTAENRILFVNTGKPFEKAILAETGFNLECITAEGIKGRNFSAQLRSILRLPKSIFQSIRILKTFKPDLVVGMGSYSAGPVIIGAWLMNIQVVLHEQNLLPGMTNRIFSNFAKKIYVSFENTKRLRKDKIRYTGNPVRAKIRSGFDFVKRTEKQGEFTVLIIGGSQGAHSINMAVIDALKYFSNVDNYHFIHQTGSNDEEMIRDAYIRSKVSAKVQSFFHDMDRLYQQADLVICRAGATTVAELAVAGKAAVFVPFPFASDNHQVKNAEALVSSGAGEMILESDLNGSRLEKKISYYAANTEVLQEMAAKAKQMGRPEAAEMIVDDCYKMVKN